MKACLDTSVLVSLFCSDAHTHHARHILTIGWDALIVSDFAGAEFSAAIARRVRTADLSLAEAATIFSAFDE